MIGATIEKKEGSKALITIKSSSNFLRDLFNLLLDTRWRGTQIFQYILGNFDKAIGAFALILANGTDDLFHKLRVLTDEASSRHFLLRKKANEFQRNFAKIDGLVQ